MCRTSSCRLGLTVLTKTAWGSCEPRAGVPAGRSHPIPRIRRAARPGIPPGPFRGAFIRRSFSIRLGGGLEILQGHAGRAAVPDQNLDLLVLQEHSGNDRVASGRETDFGHGVVVVVREVIALLVVEVEV